MADAEYMRLGCAPVKFASDPVVMPSGKANRVCEHCGELYENRDSRSMYCSGRCKITAWRKKNPDQLAVLRLRSQAKKAEITDHERSAKRMARRAEYERKAAIRNASDLVAKLVKHRDKANRLCAKCGCVVGYKFGKPRTYCSTECRESSAEFLESKRKNKAHRRAMQRGANRAERVSPTKVFEAAGWK